MKFSVRLLVGVLLVGPLLHAKDAKGPPKASIQGFLQQYAYYPVAFEWNENDPFLLKGSLDGKPITFAVDTGCPVTALDPKRTAGLKTLKELHTKISDSLMGVIDNPAALLVPSLTIGQARFVNLPAVASTLEVDYAQLPWDGLLGVDFLKRNFCVIDCGGMTIFFRATKPTEEQARAIAESYRQSGFSPIPFHGIRRLVIDSSIVGEPVKLMVDTGARYTMLEEQTRVRLKLSTVKADTQDSFLPTTLETKMLGLTTNGLGTVRTHMVQLPEIVVGDRTWKDVYITSGETNLTAFKDHGGKAIDVHGIFGADLLMMHGAIIDFSSETIWLPATRH